MHNVTATRKKQAQRSRQRLNELLKNLYESGDDFPQIINALENLTSELAQVTNLFLADEFHPKFENNVITALTQAGVQIRKQRGALARLRNGR